MAFPTASSPRQAEEWALVLAAEGVRAEVRREPEGLVVHVPAEEYERAIQILTLYEIEASRETDDDDDDDAVAEGGAAPLAAALAVSGSLLLFFLATGSWRRGVDWFERGNADAGAIAAGELWRAVTALTLHADGAHVLSNAVAGALLFTAVFRSQGIGFGLLLILLAGVGGNLMNAILRGTPHLSVGASTAVFGAVGLLGGLGAIRHRRRSAMGRGPWVPLAAGLALLAMLGTAGGRTDIWAHLLGLLAGGALGLGVSRGWLPAPGPLAQWLLGGAAIAIVLQCWGLALR